MTIHIRRKDKTLKINKLIYGEITKDGFIRIINSLINSSNYEYLLILGDDPIFNRDLKKALKLNINIITSEFLNKKSSVFNDLFFMINSKGLIVNNSSFSLWAGYLSDSNYIFYPDRLFPLPKHISIKDLKIEDLVMPSWESYQNEYI